MVQPRSKPSNNNELPVIPGNRDSYQRADVITIRQIRSLLYDQGYTIGGAKQQLSSVEAKDDISQYKQLIRQTIRKLEDVLAVL
ncbi:MerR family transcriptional regulator [Marinobacter sp. ELB17]|uniref:MerR family transcriptional regulator n=1 Tax=Marinobacter sp. ELB17 TaxID=270374 RepID=UPI0009FCDB21